MIKKVLIAVAVLLFGAVASEATVWDLEKFFPGERARTHDLVAADGQKLTYSFPGGGSFGRVVDARGTDWQFWTDTGLIYVGWDWNEPGSPPVAFRTIPFNLNVPRWFDDTAAWTTTYSDVVTRQQYDEATKKWELVSFSPSEIVSVEIRQAWLAGEWTLLMKGGVPGVYEERWWFSPCVQVAGETTCSPGVRQVQMFYGGSNIPLFERRFEEWTKK